MTTQSLIFSLVNFCKIHGIMAPKKEKRPFKPTKKSLSVIPKKFIPLYYESFDAARSCSLAPSGPHAYNMPSSSSRDNGASSSSMASVENSFPTNLSVNETNPFYKESWFLKSLCDLQDKSEALERKRVVIAFLKLQLVVLKH